MFSLNFWFDIDPGPLSPLFSKLLLAVTAIFLLAAIISKIFSKIEAGRLAKPIWKKSYYLFLTNFIVGLLMIFFLNQSILFFSARFWFVVWVIGDAVWLYFIIRAILRIPERKKELAREQEYKKYLPK